MAGLSSLTVNAQTILVNAPLVLDTPGSDKNIMAFHDGQQFWIDVTGLAMHLGYETLDADSLSITLRDANRVMTFDMESQTVKVNQEVTMNGLETQRGPDGELLVSLPALSTAFGGDLTWDASALTLRLSSNPILFTSRPVQSSLTQPAELVFPRERALLGGVHLFYDVNHRWSPEGGSEFRGNVRASAAVAWGVLRANLSRRQPSVSNAVEMNHRWLTRVNVTWRGVNAQPGLEITNKPLVYRRVFSQRTHRGVTIPHAIVRLRAGGNDADQVQADGEGRFAIPLPVYYGTTRSSIDVAPLGQAPLQTEYSYELTPLTALKKGRLEYSVGMNRRWTASVGYGVNDRVTVRANGSTDPTRLRIESTLRPFRSLYIALGGDPIDHSGNAKLKQWRSWGEYELSWTRYSDASQYLSGVGHLQSGQVSVSSTISHHRSSYRDPYTRIAPAIGWQSTLGLTGRLQSQITIGESPSLALHPDLSWVLTLGRARMRVSHGAEVVSGKVAGINSTIRFARRQWNVSVVGQKDLNTDQLSVALSVQYNTDWAWLGAEGRMVDDQITLTQRARGTIGIDQGITFSSTAIDHAQARFRVFTDTNLNGVLDDNESLLYTPMIKVNNYQITRRLSGEFTTQDLSPNETYTVEITPESIVDPMLYPVTGYRFAFVAQAGRTRTMDVALQPLPVMEGHITGWGAAYEILRVTVVGNSVTQELDVYRDGGFFTLLPPGRYDVTVVNQITNQFITQRTVTFRAGAPDIIIDVAQ
ncbi:MAG: hypothetical protein OXE59_12735 [Bacteroidetes bacterium]|nr:hypothetical protein [Bacteroidota bacterium]